MFKSTRFFGRTSLALAAIMFTAIGSLVAKTYACECAFSGNDGTNYSVAYTASGGGCCNGSTSGGLSHISESRGGSTNSGYASGEMGQSMCCGR